jgi:hypothetical protein
VTASTFAAWLPSRTASRTSVLDALAGRRDVLNVPRRLLPIGSLAIAIGTGLEFLTALGTSNNSDGSNANVYLITGASGGLLILAGMCCLGPVIVSVFGPVGARSRGIFRLTARSLSRNRARSSAVVVAIAAFVAMGLTASTAYLTSHDWRTEWEPADNVVAVWSTDCTGLTNMEQSSGDQIVQTPCTITKTSNEVQSAIDEIMEGAHRSALRWAVFDPAPYNPDMEGNYAPGETFEIRDPGAVMIADKPVLDSIGLSSRDHQTFDKIGAVWVVNPNLFDAPTFSYLGFGSYFDATQRTLRITLVATTGKHELLAHVVRDLPAHAAPGTTLLITEAKARELGLAIAEFGTIYVSDYKLAEWQQVEVRFVSSYDPVQPQLGYVSIEMASSAPGVSRATVETMISTGVLLVTLLIVAIGLSLMAAESKDERDVLVAMGASPRALGSLAALRAWLLTMCAVLLAIPIGLIPVSIVFNAVGADNPTYEGVVLPWRTIGLLMCVPFVAYAATRLVTATTHRARPVTMSNFAFD